MLLAEVAAMQGDVEPALGRFQVILARKPDHFRALFRLLDVLKRTGNLASASDYLEAARHASPRTATSAGYQTCEGALHRSCNRPQARCCACAWVGITQPAVGCATHLQPLSGCRRPSAA